jgi:PAS domain S-box-containing protein
VVAADPRSSAADDADGKEAPPTSMIERAWSSLSDAMALATPGDGARDPSVVVANEAFCSLFGLEEAEVRGRPLGAFLSMDRSSLRQRVDDLLDGVRPAVTDLVVLRCTAGSPRLVEWELAPVRSEDGRVERLLALLHDVTHTAVRRTFGTGSDVDPLTGLPNRLHLFSRVERSVEHAARGLPYSFAVVALEAGGLTEVEESLGPAIAGALLEAVVHRIRPVLRTGDLVTRSGRQQLVILLDRFAPAGDPNDVLRRVVAVTERPYVVGGKRVTLRTLGVAGPVIDRERPPDGAPEVMDLLEQALERARAARSSAPSSADSGSVGSR